MSIVKLGTAQIIRANALDLPVADESVDLIVTSPPYFALRSYRDEGEHYDGQIGSEPTPTAFLDVLIAATREMMRVLKPSGSIWVNLGDKYAGSGGHNNAGVSDKSTLKNDGRKNPKPVTNRELALRDLSVATRRNAPNRYNQNSDGIRPKSLMGLPWRYAIRCIDELGLILRAEIVWDKPNGLPESVTDRVRRSHEQWFHFTKSQRYFAAVDEVREPHAEASLASEGRTYKRVKPGHHDSTDDGIRKTGMQGVATTIALNPLGKLPGSVWSIPSQPLSVPDELGVDHFAAFPTEWPRRIILGWSPSGICTECGEGRRLTLDRPKLGAFHDHCNNAEAGQHQNARERNRRWREAVANGDDRGTITGYACACPEPIAPTTPATVLDPFGGTGTVALVAKALGRNAISVDLSGDYCKLAQWRCNDPQNLRNVQARTYGIKRDAPTVMPGQAALFEDGAA